MASEVTTPSPKAEPLAEQSSRFVREVHEIVRDLLEANPAIFWCDFLLTIGIAYATLAVYLTTVNFSVLQIGAGLICALAMYRATVFTHELEHRRPGTFGAFRFVWNLLCGIPFFMPSFLYDDHKGHHSNLSYGTDGDSEYLSLAKGRTWRAVVFLAVSLVYPILGPLRFMVFTPLVLVRKRADKLVFETMSSLYMLNPKYRREYDESARSSARWAQEIGCCLFGWSIAAGIWFGYLPMSILPKLYFVFLAWVFINQLRTLTAHYYGSEGRAFNYAEQVLDSNTFANGWLPELWAPLGMRYHALHHVMPTMPYHTMGRAHRKLMAELSPDSPYRRTIRPNLPSALRDAFFGRRESDAAASATPN